MCVIHLDLQGCAHSKGVSLNAVPTWSMIPDMVYSGLRREQVMRSLLQGMAVDLSLRPLHTLILANVKYYRK